MQKRGYRDTIRRSPTLVFTIANHFKCISVQIEHNSVGCHGEMYFDIVETTATMHKQTKTLAPTTRPRQKDNEVGGEVKGCSRPVMGLPWPPPLFLGGEKDTGTMRPVNNCTYQIGTTSRGSPTLAVLLSRSLYRSHVLTTFWGPVFRSHDDWQWDTVGHCGAFWTCKSTAVCQSCAKFGKKRCNLIFGAVKK